MAGEGEADSAKEHGCGETEGGDFESGDEGVFAHRVINAGDLVVVHFGDVGDRPADARSGGGPKTGAEEKQGEGGDSEDGGKAACAGGHASQNSTSRVN